MTDDATPASHPVTSGAPSGATPYPTRRALREARERAAREAAAAGSGVVLVLPTAPAAPDGPVAFDESHVSGPPVAAHRATPPAPARPAVAVPTLAGRLAAARAGGSTPGGRPAASAWAPIVPAAVEGVAAAGTPATAAAATPVPRPPVSAPTGTAPTGTAPTGTAPTGAAFVRAGTTRPPGRPVVRDGAHPGARRPHLNRAVRWSAQAAVLAAVVGTTGAFAMYHRSMTLDVDGNVEAVDAYGWTVADVLAQQHVAVGPDDVVEPALSASARGVDTVVVRRSHDVQVEINGETRTVRTTASTVGELMDSLGERGDAAYASASRSQALGRDPIRLVTSKQVHVLVDGQDVAITTTAATVQQVLDDAGVTLGAKDTVSAPGDAAAVDGMVVLVSRGRSTSATETEVLKFSSSEVKDPTLPKGQRVVQTAGRVGQVVRTYRVVTKGGVEVSRTLLSQRVAVQPVDEVVKVGTMVLPDPASVVVSPGSAQAIAKGMVADRGWDAQQFACLVSLWNRESGWRVTASNGSSGAYGIPQALPGSKMASVGPDWRTNAATQIAWGLGYISSRYGTPCGAWNHSQSTGWY